MWSTPSWPLLSGLLRPGVVVPVSVPSLGQLELFDPFPRDHIIR